MKKRRAKKRFSRNSKPVLTSPWKIGILVSLLLVFVGLGVGGYFVSVYRVRFAWISLGPNGVSFDSLRFFREMYPLVAVLSVISLIAYFAIVSSVRRYRFYLDSGQDYRKMISLAESIDDLTNPAQIARLSSFPELQGVLRAYGDQVRDIAQDLGQQQDPMNVEEFEADVEAMLGENDVKQGALGTKPYAGGLRRIVQRLAADRAKAEDLSKQEESVRRSIGLAALACGRVMEAAGGAGEELTEIDKSIGDIHRAAGELVAGAQSAGSAQSANPDAWKTAGAGVESAARKLEDGKTLLQELADENNSVAIALALLAARDKAGGHELAAFAERVRITSERFHKLSKTIEPVAKGLLDSCYALKGVPPPAAGVKSPAEAGDGAFRAIDEIAGEIERRSANLQNRICGIGNELCDLRELLRGERANQAPGEGLDSFEPSERAPAAEAAEPDERDGGEETFVVDHGSAWAGMTESAGGAEERFDEPAPEADEASAADRRETPAAQAAPQAMGEFSDMSSLRDLDRSVSAESGESVPEDAASAVEESESAPEESGSAPETPRAADGAWMEMPGHRWLKIDINKSEGEEERPVDVAVESPSPETEAPVSAATEDEEESAAERIYDLSELGAVECVEEAEVQR